MWAPIFGRALYKTFSVDLLITECKKWLRDKCRSINFKDSYATFVTTSMLKGGVPFLIFLFWSYTWVCAQFVRVGLPKIWYSHCIFVQSASNSKILLFLYSAKTGLQRLKNVQSHFSKCFESSEISNMKVITFFKCPVGQMLP